MSAKQSAKQFLLNAWSNAWNGPFSLGPLTKPVVAGDAVMKLLEVAWKVGFLCLSAYLSFLIVAVILIATGINDWLMAHGFLR